MDETERAIDIENIANANIRYGLIVLASVPWISSSFSPWLLFVSIKILGKGKTKSICIIYSELPATRSSLNCHSYSTAALIFTIHLSPTPLSITPLSCSDLPLQPHNNTVVGHLFPSSSAISEEWKPTITIDFFLLISNINNSCSNRNLIEQNRGRPASPLTTTIHPHQPHLNTQHPSAQSCSSDSVRPVSIGGFSL